MDLATVGWIALGWFAVALVLSLALGGFLRKVNTTVDQEGLAVAASRQKVMRYMRGRKPTGSQGKLVTRLSVEGKRATG
jgi:hypothetical protein